MRNLLTLALALIGSSTLVASAQISNYAPVTDARLLNPEPGNWLSYRGNYSNWGYSPLTQITSANVSRLRPVWAFSTGETAGHEAPAIVNNGVMFITAPNNGLYALNAKTGQQLWQYKREIPEDLVTCCDIVNRGVALYGDMVLMGTLDAHVLAFNAKTGKIIWDRTIEDYKKRYTITSAPLVADGKIITGIHGGEYGVRGFLEALDPKTGKTIWKTYTTVNGSYPAGGAETGGASTWVTGSYDPGTKTVYWGTSNPSPWIDPRAKESDDRKWSSSVLAFDVKTGKIKTGFQYSPNDVWDFDGVNEQILIDTVVNGKTMKSIVSAHRNGYLYLLDRANGGLKYVDAHKFIRSTVYQSIDKNGRPVWNPQARPAVGKQASACPSLLGGKNWNPAAYSPLTKLVYIPSNESCMTIKGSQVKYAAGEAYIGAESDITTAPGLNHIGKLQAVDPVTGKQVWAQTFNSLLWGGVLTTGGNLVFTGSSDDRNFNAFDAKTGKKLWSFKTNSGVIGVPVSFQVEGKQYVGVYSGFGGVAGFFNSGVGAKTKDIPTGGVFWVFALD
ncbi:PQQ-dependent dehydrogenase, methanol/ethanol family [Deinococcus yavapaiensis]|uniref:Alcohol dehydrogenase (Cytochrome c) n=1 Tax=Deinococcus yavapaiensis KR-236 TaxID=694435 RepID=A0A318S6C0_9DEIO|nr:PQQ-dependent dehydrogenase, methanol/ethanol family [Deinococcus yavapaiensis]PYE53267.1 alcohol dehydrogenase (cytochrome c) [Deinococcus yavapaiensis KR-236]